MLLVVVVLVGALVLGWAAGGSLGRLATLPVHGRWLVAAAVAAQLAGALATGAGAPRAAYAAGLAASAVLAGWFLARNRRLAGVPLVALGLLANAAVVAANGAMPVSLYAAARAGVATGPIAGGSDPRHVLAGDGTTAAVLGDVVPVPLPWHPEVVSAGDVLIAAGLGLLVVTGMRRRPDAVVEWGDDEEDDRWRRSPGSARLAPGRRPTTASAPTPE